MTQGGLREVLRQQCAEQSACTDTEWQKPDLGLQASVGSYFQTTPERTGQTSEFSHDFYYYKWLRCQGERNKEFFSFLLSTYHLQGTVPSTYLELIDLIPITAP